MDYLRRFARNFAMNRFAAAEPFTNLRAFDLRIFGRLRFVLELRFRFLELELELELERRLRRRTDPVPKAGR